MADPHPVIITCAVTGSIHTPSMSPHLPVTPREIADAAVGAAEAGAAIVHLHARDPVDGHPTQDPKYFREFAADIKRRSNVVLNFTTGGAATMTIEERLQPALQLKPEVASLNMGSMNFGLFPMLKRFTTFKHPWEREYLATSNERIFRNTFRDIEYILTSCADNGTRFEIECYDIGHLYTAHHFLERGVVKPPLFIQSVFGILGGIGPHPDDVLHMKRTADRLFGDQYRWSVLGAGRNQLPIAAQSAAMGGNVRVGLEDSLWIGKGKLAESNAAQVRAARQIIEGLGLTVADARRRAPCPSAEGRRERGVPTPPTIGERIMAQRGDADFLAGIRSRLYTAVLSDVLDECGHPAQAMAPSIRPLDESLVLAGFARTGLYREVYHVEPGVNPYELEIALVDDLRPDDVVVFGCGASRRIAPWGELLSTAATVRGAAGCVTDGFVRDIRATRAMKFPVFHGGIAPLDSKGRGMVAAIDVPIECGGVRVAPGDVVVGDADGVVVVPRAIEEARVRARVREGCRRGHDARRAARRRAAARRLRAPRHPLTRAGATPAHDHVGGLHAGAVSGGGALNGGSVIGARRAPKSSASARFLAVRSRSVIGASRQRHSIIFRIEQCSYGPAFSIRRGANGPIAIAGTRKPSRSRSGNGPGPVCGVSSWHGGGATWSKKPPCSSKFSTNTIRFHCGLAASASCTPATNSSATSTLPAWW